MMSEKDYIEAIRSLRNRTARLEREGDYWTEEEKKQLAIMFAADRGITEIAICLQRTEPAVFQQAIKMGLYRGYDGSKRKRRKNPCCCACGACNCPVSKCPRGLLFKERKEHR